MSYEHHDENDEVPGYGDPADWPVLDLADFYGREAR